MGHADYLKNGDWNAICDRCGSKFKFSMLKKEWDGLYVCSAKGCWEARQPQDYVKGIRDNMSVPVSRPGGGNNFIQDETVTEQTVVTILKGIGKTIITSVSSAVSIIKTLYPFTGNDKTIDGSAINRTTLG